MTMTTILIVTFNSYISVYDGFWITGFFHLIGVCEDRYFQSLFLQQLSFIVSLFQRFSVSTNLPHYYFFLQAMMFRDAFMDHFEISDIECEGDFDQVPLSSLSLLSFNCPNL
mgnify:CR=1 FL=1